MLKELVAFLRERRNEIVSSKEVLVDRWSPTYGPQDPGVETIEFVDFDRLLSAIDEFSHSFKW